jgi:alpha-beta hydrolase superfamily lysophospholipase
MSFVKSEVPSTSAEGLSLAKFVWNNTTAGVPLHAVCFFVHGLFDHSQRYGELAAYLNRHGVSMVSLDWIGHGLSGGTPRGHIDDFRTIVDDFVALIETTMAQTKEFKHLPYAIIGKATGAVLATHIVHAVLLTDGRIPKPRSLLLISPAGKVKDTFSRTRKVMAKLVSNVAPNLGVASFDVNKMNRDEAERAAYAADELVVHGKIDSGTAATLLKAVQTQESTFGDIKCPLFIAAAELEAVVDRDSAASLFSSLDQAPAKVLKCYRGAWHDLVHDPEKHALFTDLVDFLDGSLSCVFSSRNTSVRVNEFVAKDALLSCVVPDSLFVRLQMLAEMRGGSAPVQPSPDASSDPFDLPAPPTTSAILGTYASTAGLKQEPEQQQEQQEKYGTYGGFPSGTAVQSTYSSLSLSPRK